MSVHAEAPELLEQKRHRFGRRFVRRPLTVLSLAWLLGVVAAALLASELAPFQPTETDYTAILSGPSGSHLLGTDALGRDILSRALYGGRITLQGVGEALAVFLLSGSALGLVAGYSGGWIETAITRVADVVFSIPLIITLLVVYGVYPGSQDAVMVAFGILAAPSLLRVVRAATLATKQELFIDAARVAGLSAPRILMRHVLPRIAGTIIVQATVFASIALLVQCGLTFLGLGVHPPNPSWGGLIGDASTVMSRQPWMLVPSGGLVILTIVAFNLLGASVRSTAVGAWSRPRLSPRRRPVEGASAALPADPDALLSVRGLAVAVEDGDGEAGVVDDVSFDVYPGETLGVMGESGCGKTMTMLAILGVLPAGVRVTAGTCALAGTDLLRLPERRLAGIRGRALAYVSQEPMVSLDPMFAVGTQVAEAVRAHTGAGRKEARRRAVELLRQVRLPDPERVYTRFPHQLSGGMAQRVAIAFALAGDPQLLIADEPTTALDVTVQAEILQLLRTLQRERGMSVLLVTHDWGVVADSCSRAVVMYAGQIVESAEVAELFHRPRHPYTRALLAASPHALHSTERLPTIPGGVPAPREWSDGCRFAPRCTHARSDCRRGVVPLDGDGGRSSRCLYTNELLAGEPA